MIQATIPWDAMHDEMVITGRALREGKEDSQRGETSEDEVVYRFRRETVASVREKLEGKIFYKVDIDFFG